jgi:hypothetical protein
VSEDRSPGCPSTEAAGTPRPPSRTAYRYARQRIQRPAADQVKALRWSADVGPWPPAFDRDPFRTPRLAVEWAHATAWNAWRG